MKTYMVEEPCSFLSVAYSAVSDSLIAVSDSTPLIAVSDSVISHSNGQHQCLLMHISTDVVMSVAFLFGILLLRVFALEGQTIVWKFTQIHTDPASWQ